ncbi:MAG: DUF1700 domain-containing protein [Clostridia bacterium]|nr:DUF1700 domain-containing protein [Clostridia bacterium]
MNKQEFLRGLRTALSGLPQDDIEERVTFYGEMIDDRIEEGMSEDEAVAGIGTVDEVRAQTIAEIPLQKLVKEKVRPKRALRGWEVVLIVLGFPVWFPLLVAAAAVVLSFYIAAWALIISLWAVEISLWVSVLGAVAVSAVFFAQGNSIPAFMMLGVASVAAGLSVFMFFGCAALSGGIIKLTKKAGVGVKSMFIGKENSK